MWKFPEESITDLFTKRDNKNLSPRGVGNFIFEIALFAMFGALMFASKKIMEVIPNVHLLGMFIMVLTVVFRVKALIPIYLYIMLDGLFGGFGMWWIPYLYIWAVLWGITMLLPKNIPPKIAAVVYPLICALHGLAFGTLYAPTQALMYGLDFEQTLTWIAVGIPYDLIHCVSNLCVGILILPFSQLLKKLISKSRYKI